MKTHATNGQKVTHLIRYVKKKWGGWTEESSGKKEVETETVMSPVVATQPFSCTYLQRGQTDVR